MPIRSQHPNHGIRVPDSSAAENVAEPSPAPPTMSEAETTLAHRSRSGDARLAALQSIQASRTTPPAAVNAAVPDFRALVDSLIAPHALLYSEAPLTGQQCFEFVKASSVSFGRCAELLDQTTPAMQDESSRHALRTLKHACIVFSERMPVKRWDVKARYEQALALAGKKLPPMFVLTQDFGQWVFKNFAAIQSLLGVTNAANRQPDQHPEYSAFLTIANQSARLKFAHAL